MRLQFFKDVLNFLESEYGDAYKFEIDHWASTLPDSAEKAELSITLFPGYKRIIDSYTMTYLYGWYLVKEFIEEHNQYRWQKELIDMIEGG